MNVVSISLGNKESSVLSLVEAAVTANREMSAITERHEHTRGPWPDADDCAYRDLAQTLNDMMDRLAETPALTLADCQAKARAIHECCDAVTLHNEAALSLAQDVAALLHR